VYTCIKLNTFKVLAVICLGWHEAAGEKGNRWETCAGLPLWDWSYIQLCHWISGKACIKTRYRFY